MNKVYKLIWSKTKNMYVVASEFAKSHTKSAKSSVISRTLTCGVLACVIGCGVVMPVMAAEVTLGNTTVTNGGNVNEVVIIGNGAKADFGYTDSSVNASSSGVLIGAGATVISEKAPGVNNVVIGPSSGYQDLARAIAYRTGSVSIGSSIRNHSIDGIAIGGSNYIDGNDAIAFGKYAVSSGSNSVSLGAFSVSMEKDTVSFGHLTGDPSTSVNGDWIFENFDGDLSASATFKSDYFRRLINVANGKNTHDVSVVDQTGNSLVLDGKKLQLNNVLGTKLNEVDLSNISGASYTAGDNISITNDKISATGLIKYDDDTKKTATLEGGSRGTKLTNLTAGGLSRTSTDAVVGAQLWATNQNLAGMQTDINTNKGNILSLNTSMTNALESISATAELVNTLEDLKADTSLNNLTSTGKLVIKNAAADAVQEYMAGNNKVVPMSKSVSFDKVIDGSEVVAYDDDSLETITLEGPVGVGTKITNVADGDVSAASMDAVTGAQLYAVQQQFDTFQSSLATNNATIAAVQTDVNTLKTSYLTMSSDVNTLKTQMETGFNVTIDGAKVKQVNPDANQVNFVTGDNISLENSNSGVKISATGEGAVTEGDTKLVNGNTVYLAIQDALAGVNEDLNNKANISLNNINNNGKSVIRSIAQQAVKVVPGENTGVTISADNGAITYAVNAFTTGTVTSESEGIVSGKTVYTEVRPNADGNYIATANTTGANLTALDEQIKANTDAIDELKAGAGQVTIPDNVVTYDSETKDKVTFEGQEGTVLSNVADGTEDKDAANVGQLKGVKTELEGRIKITEDLLAGDWEGKTVKEHIDEKVDRDELDEALAGKANVDLDNITDAGKTVVRNLAQEAIDVKGEGAAVVTSAMEDGKKVFTVSVTADGAVEEGNAGLVDGGTVYDAIKDANQATQDALDGKADTDLGNITDDGKEVIREVMKDDLDGKANVGLDNITDEGKEVIREVMKDDLDKKADKDSVYTKDETDDLLADKADKDYVDDELAKKANKDASNIETAKWAEKLGTGKIEEGNTDLVNGGTVYDALKDLDGFDIINQEDDTIRIGGKDKYDTADAVDISKSDGSGRILRGVVTDPDDKTSAASVGYVDDKFDEFGREINGAFKAVNNRIDEVGANAAALANLHPFEYEGQKWNIAAAYGGYNGEHAAAVGLFYRPSERVMINASTTVSNDRNMYGAGVSVMLDKPMYNSRKELMDLVKRQGDEINQLKHIVNQLVNKTTVMDNMKKGFPDVPRNHWANNAVSTLHGNGVLAGYPDGEFKGDKQMTRYEYAEMLYKAMKRGVEIPKEVISEYQKELSQIGK